MRKKVCPILLRSFLCVISMDVATTTGRKSKQEINQNKALAANITHLYRFNVILAGGFNLSLGAGFIGGASLAGLFTAPVVHMSGNALGTGVALARLEWMDMLNLALVWTSFICGSALSAFMVSGTRKFRLKRIYGLALLVECGWLFLAYLTSQDGLVNKKERLVWLSEFYAAIAMGMQNALCTTYSGAVIRTTHVTGSFTDIGMVIGHELRIRFGLRLYTHLKHAYRDSQHGSKCRFIPLRVVDSTDSLRNCSQEPEDTPVQVADSTNSLKNSSQESELHVGDSTNSLRTSIQEHEGTPLQVTDSTNSPKNSSHESELHVVDSTNSLRTSIQEHEGIPLQVYDSTNSLRNSYQEPELQVVDSIDSLRISNQEPELEIIHSTDSPRISCQEPENGGTSLSETEEPPEPSILWRLKVLIPLSVGYIVGAALGAKAYIAWGREALLVPILFIGTVGLVYGISTHLLQTYRRVRSSTGSGRSS
jgi:uncharacterized membrane protein YoaK (UPF0700 family)